MHNRFILPDVTVDVDGSSIRVLDVGDGPAVVLAHSYLWDAEMWRPQIDCLSRSYRVIVPELWGHGGSGRMPAETTSLATVAKQHLAVLDRLGVERFALVGLSVGGMWGAELAIFAPERLVALVLMDTYLGPEPTARRDRYLTLLAAVAASGAVPEALLSELIPLYLSSNAATAIPDIVGTFRSRLQTWDKSRLVDTIVPLGRLIFNRRDALGDLSRLTIPALVMTGTEDLPRPIKEGQVMARLLGCRFVAIPDAGHISNLEAPAVVNRQLVSFLEQAFSE
jgi:pimeloyl-ACP methyl ester carboxylesterase